MRRLRRTSRPQSPDFPDLSPADRMFLAALHAEADVRMRRAETTR